MRLMTRLAAPVLLSMTCLLSTGCMTSPGNLEFVGSKNDPVEFNGYCQQPNRWVRIEAKHLGSGVWETIGWAKSGSHRFHYSGEDFYYWSNDVPLADRYWTFFEERYFAEVRVRDFLTGDELYTFDAGFYSYFDPSESLGDLWIDHGHGTTATIFAN